MSVETTRAIIPFQGMIQPVQGIGHKPVDPNGTRNPQRIVLFDEYRPQRGSRNYGRLGRFFESRAIRGENIDIYV